MTNLSDEQRTLSFNHEQRSLYPNPLSSAQTKHQQILKLQADTLFLKLTQLEDKLKHYSKLKRKWNRFKTILRYSKYPIAILFAGADIRLSFIPIIEIPLAIISTAVTLGDVIGANVLENSFVNVKVNTYDKNVNILLNGLIECICLNKIHYVIELLMQKKLINGNKY